MTFDFFDLLEKMGVGNIAMLIGFCVAILSMAAGYIQAFHASQYEAALMNKSEESKRFFFVYVVLFLVFGFKNFVFSTDASFCVVNVIILVLIFPISLVAKLIFKIRKSPNSYSDFCESRNLIFLMVLTAVFIYVVSAMINTPSVTDEANMPSVTDEANMPSMTDEANMPGETDEANMPSVTDEVNMPGVTDETNMINMNSLSVVIFGSLIEVFVIAMTILNTSKLKTTIFIMIDDEKWYVFKRIDEEYLLCGKDCKVNDSAKARLIKISDIVENNICFEKEMKEAKGEETKAEEAKTEETKTEKAKTEEVKTKKTKSKKTGKVITVRIRI